MAFFLIWETCVGDEMRKQSLQRRKRIGIKLLIILGIVILILGAGCIIYVNDYYHADELALEYIEQPLTGTSVSVSDDVIVVSPDDVTDIDTGFIFYPGGKVEYSAYVPLMEKIASNGAVCFIVKMPCNLAILGISRADKILDEHPEISSWYIGGHSLGGAAAAMYLEDNAEKFEGLLLLGAYSSTNLSDTGLSVLSIYGSNDGVLNREKYESDKVNLPDDFTELVIDGGCHAYFGSYGEQSGDGEAEITAEEQQDITAAETAAWMGIGGEAPQLKVKN